MTKPAESTTGKAVAIMSPKLGGGKLERALQTIDQFSTEAAFSRYAGRSNRTDVILTGACEAALIGLSIAPLLTSILHRPVIALLGGAMALANGAMLVTSASDLKANNREEKKWSDRAERVKSALIKLGVDEATVNRSPVAPKIEKKVVVTTIGGSGYVQMRLLNGRKARPDRTLTVA